MAANTERTETSNQLSVNSKAPPVEGASTDGSPKTAPEDEYPPQKTVLLIVAALFCTSFLIALDRTIIATAIPTITNQFNSLSDVGWYASSYLLTTSAFQLLMGRVYTFYSPKWVYISCVAVFEVGSLVCASAPSSPALIVGRAIAGIGSAGLMSGAITIIVHILPLHKRPAYMGIFGAVFALASVAGPLLGGVFTDKVSWRWCFYINLPIGGVTLVVLAWVLELPDTKRERVTYSQQIRQLDPIGTSVFIPSVTCLLLALQWGGITYSWSSWRIILLLVLSVVLFAIFVWLQFRLAELATIPIRIIRNRSILAGTTYSFCSGAGMMAMVYFLPIWFQAIKGASAVRSGIMNLPAILAMTFAAMFAGILTRKIGYYMPWMYASTILTPIGAGLISTFDTSTGHQRWIGYQALWGLGMGLGMQQASVAAQTVLSKRDVPTGVSILFFAQTLGGSLFVSIANNVFDNKLSQGLHGLAGINGDLVTHTGATDIRHVVPPEALDSVLYVYNLALRNAFYVVVAVTCGTVVGTVFMEWKSIKAEATSPGSKPGSAGKDGAKEEVSKKQEGEGV